MIKKILLSLAAIILAFVIYVALRPADYVISREITIQAPAEKIFPYLNNSKLANTWMPWSKLDPQAKMSFSGPDAGPGARTDWNSGTQLGTGSATIVESVPNQKVGIKLEYTQPFAMTQDAEYSVRTEGAQSVVTWSVRGKNTFPARLMCVFMNMDKMVGGTFEQGLASLKQLVENSHG